NGTTAISSNRRFYNAPDVALIQRRGAEPYFNIAIGSGYRGHPLHTETHDRFYSLRDRLPFAKLTQTQYQTVAPIEDSDLVDVTDDLGSASLPAGAPGWKLELRRNGGWTGEKVLADAVTLGGTILFTTYQPVETPTDPCLPATGINRAYALKVDNAAPALDFNNDAQLDARDAFTQLATRGIAGEVSLVMESTRGRDNGPPGDGGPTDPLGRRSLCVVGVEVLHQCVDPGAVVRTYWRRSAPGDNE
ncbi:MAG: hypothetical protein NZM12_00720, partial [Steroidobacteraceae bacterium]|nr:hypothetical protein [Steroidobacteraceae bacterium]